MKVRALKFLRALGALSCAAGLVWLRFFPGGSYLYNPGAQTALAGFALSALASVALLLLPERARAGLRDLKRALRKAPAWIAPVADRETAEQARIACGITLGKSLVMGDLFKAVRPAGGEFYFCDAAEIRHPHSRPGKYTRFTLAFASAGRDIFPDFRLTPRNRGHKLPVQLTEVPGFPSFSAAYFLSGPDAGQVQAFFQSGPAAWFATHPDWLLRCDGRLVAALLRGWEEIPVADLPAFAEAAGDMLAGALKLGGNGFTGFTPPDRTEAIRSNGF